MVRNYKKYIAENRGVIYISTLIALLLRWAFFRIDAVVLYSHDSVFAEQIFSSVFSNIYISFFSAFLLNVVVALLVGYINEKYTLIRGRTYLPYAFTLFLLSCSPYFTYSSPAYISLLFLLLSVNTLFASYQQLDPAKYSFQIGVFLSAAGLFFPEMILFIPVFWIGASMMRSFNIKVIMASLLSVIMVGYFAVFLNYLVSANFIDSWTNHLFSLFDYDASFFSRISGKRWVVFIITTLTVIAVILYGYVYSFKDKVQTRSYMLFLNVLFFFSLLIFVVMKMHPLLLLMIILTISAVIYSHFFALATKKLEVCLFYVVLLLYLLNYILLP